MNSAAESCNRVRFSSKKRRRRHRQGEMHSVIYALVVGDNDSAHKKVGWLVSWFLTERGRTGGARGTGKLTFQRMGSMPKDNGQLSRSAEDKWKPVNSRITVELFIEL